MEDKMIRWGCNRTRGWPLLFLLGVLTSELLAQELPRENLAKETGELTLQKTVRTREYKGRQIEGEERAIAAGESLWRILIQEKGLSEKRFGQYLILLRGVNPQIKSLDMLKVGESIFFPLHPDEALGLQAPVGTRAVSGRIAAGTGKTNEYRVKQGDSVYLILRRELGIAGEGELAVYYALVKDLNPQKKSWDILQQGETIRLPVSGEPSTTLARETKPEPVPVPSLSPISLGHPRRLAAKANLTLLTQVIEALGNEVQRSGEEVISVEDATIRIDRSSFPVVYSPKLHQKVIFDPDNRIPPALRTRLGEPSIALPVLSLREGASLYEAVRDLLSRLGYQVLPAERPVVLHVGSIAFEAKGSWMALAPEENNKPQEIFVITVSNKAEEIPEYLRTELSRKGLHIRNISTAILAPVSTAGVSREIQEYKDEVKHWPGDDKELVDSLLSAWGIPFGVGDTLSIELRDGLRVDVRSDRTFETAGRRTAVFFGRLEPEIKKALQEKSGLKTIEMELTNLSRKEIIGRFLRELGEPVTYGEHRFGAADGENRERLNIKASGFLLSRRGIFLTDREVPGPLHRFFFEKGLNIVYFH
ncbi:MAG TPA: hypothetical protein VFU31_30720 [Candidatus Binatia bacterium]|nr:hypothetical protein [Candidatus Binatia bacterium]